MRGVDARVHIYTAVALERSRMGSPMLDCLYTGERPRYSFYRRLSGLQDWSGHGVKKNLHLSRHWDWTQAVQPLAKHLAALVSLLYHLLLFIIIISVFCLRAGLSLQMQEPALKFCPKTGLCRRRNQHYSSVQRQVFHCKLRNQGCSFTRDK